MAMGPPPTAGVNSPLRASKRRCNVRICWSEGFRLRSPLNKVFSSRQGSRSESAGLFLWVPLINLYSPQLAVDSSRAVASPCLWVGACHCGRRWAAMTAAMLETLTYHRDFVP